ncbi:MAG TPA: YtxH domain-containing protein [Terriglobia bacterium]|nr:YtxH domain-containing protein [Terriglobia bacterium]
MDDRKIFRRNGSNVWPYILVGSAIGGAVGYLLKSESGRKIRRSVAHPDELADNVDQARNFIERNARVVTDQVHRFMGKAKNSIEEGQYAYREAGQQYRTRARRIENKNREITADVHDTVDKISGAAAGVEQSILDPICEMGAMFRGFERGIKALLGKTRERSTPEGPIPIRDRMMGS